MKRVTHRLTIPSSTRFLAKVRRFVETYAAEARFSEREISALKIAVDEACANVIKHAYNGESNHTLDIDIIVRPDKFTVRIRDRGKAFDTSTYSRPELADLAQQRRAGGLGVHIMQKVMDEVTYKTRGKSNECCLIKYRG